MILEGSRYTQARVVRVTLGDGTFQWAVLSERTSVSQQVTYQYRTAKQGDRFDILAAREYGNPLLWWVLARANPEVFYPEEIPPGAVIRIPDAESLR
jgi:nucleoid-associated protein YgaU